MYRIILASKSTYKKRLLSRLGLIFETISPKIPENHEENEDIETMVIRLAIKKGEAVKQRLGKEFNENTIIISTDQAVDLENEIIGKQPTFEASKDLLLKMSGKTHKLITGLAIFCGNKVITAKDIHIMTMYKLTQEEIARYLVKDKPFDSAGSYKIETLGISLFDSIEGKDPTAIQGLPLIQTIKILKSLGVPIP